ncbi:uncharacterized protein [Cardiocondyla obscurior]|uniref:uncharacterized protein n=1 Tax=Cardiocondyla obscurior TaxID=286306 RepID=UPI00396585CC
MGKAAMSLGRLMPKEIIRGCRPLHCTYGAPIWADDLPRNKKALASVKQAERKVAVRVARLYRTTAADAAAVMAGIPPLDIEAKSYAERYRRRTEMARRGIKPPASALAKLRLLCRRQVMSQWGSRLMAMTPDAHGFRVIGAVRPHFQQWMDGVMVGGLLGGTGGHRTWCVR